MQGEWGVPAPVRTLDEFRSQDKLCNHIRAYRITSKDFPAIMSGKLRIADLPSDAILDRWWIDNDHHPDCLMVAFQHSSFPQQLEGSSIWWMEPHLEEAVAGKVDRPESNDSLENRIRGFRINSKDFPFILSGKIAFPGIPSDAVLDRWWIDNTRVVACLMVAFRHSSYPEQVEGSEIWWTEHILTTSDEQRDQISKAGESQVSS